MKKIILIAIVLLSSYLLKAQFECFTQFDDSLNNSRMSSSNYVYDPNGPVKTIRVNFHFLLRTDGTGNFTETSDNYSARPYNGYLYAEETVKGCNQYWNGNPPLRHMPNPPVPNLPKKIQLQLCGVFFHRSTTDYDKDLCHTAASLTFKENSGEVINIYIIKHIGGGCSGYCSSEQVFIGSAYNNYKQSVDSNNTWYNSSTYKLINHELGHSFSLPHTIKDCCKSYEPDPTPNCDDGIADTPTFDELVALGYLPCPWNHPLSSNNVMDYCADQNSLSPMQISRMHACIDGGKLFYRNCKFKTHSLSITNFTTNKAYIAKYVTIPSTSNIVVGNNSALYINAEEVTIDGPFEVQLGSILSIETVPLCD